MNKLLLIILALTSASVLAGWESKDKKIPDETINIVGENSELLTGYLWYPENFDTSKKYNAVVLAHGCGGAHYKDNPEQWTAKYVAGKYKVWGKLLNTQDILVVLVDSFSSRDFGGDVGAGVCDSSNPLARPYKIDPISVRPADIAYTIKYLRELENTRGIRINKIGVLGFSNGGTSALVLSNHKDLSLRASELSKNEKVWFSLPFSSEYQADLIVAMYPGCGINGYSDQTQGIFKEHFSTYTDTFLYIASNDHALPNDTKNKCLKLRQLDSKKSYEHPNMKMKVIDNTDHQFDYKEIDEYPVKVTVKRILGLFESM